MRNNQYLRLKLYQIYFIYFCRDNLPRFYVHIYSNLSVENAVANETEDGAVGTQAESMEMAAIENDDVESNMLRGKSSLKHFDCLLCIYFLFIFYLYFFL